MPNNKQKLILSQPIFDFQADDIYNVILEVGLSKKKATQIIQKYVDKFGLLDGEELQNLFKKKNK